MQNEVRAIEAAQRRASGVSWFRYSLTGMADAIMGYRIVKQLDQRVFGQS